MADLDLKAKYMFKQAELLTRARLAALKLDQATIDQTKEVNDLRAKQAQYEADYVKNHTTTVTNRWDSKKTTTEEITRTPSAAGGGEGKIPGQQSALARQALTELEKLEAGPLPSSDTLNKIQNNSLTSTAADTAIEGGKVMSGGVSMLGREAGIVPRNRYEGLSEQDRITIQTMDRSQQLLMHVMTGAGASVEEAKKKAEAFGWVPGDTPASMKAKISGAKELANQFITPGGTAARGGKPNPSDYTPARVTKAKLIVGDPAKSEAEKAPFREFLIEARKAGVK